MEDLSLEQISITKNTFLTLDQNQLNKKPLENKWSITECFNHLNRTLEIYIPQMITVAEHPENYTGPSDNFKYSLLGKMALYAMKPKKDNTFRFKMKTFKNLEPQPEDRGSKKIINEFLSYQENTIKVIHGLRNVNLRSTKIITALGSILKMSIGDALHFMLAHNQRHIIQAQNTLQKIQ